MLVVLLLRLAPLLPLQCVTDVPPVHHDACRFLSATPATPTNRQRGDRQHERRVRLILLARPLQEKT